MSGPRRGRRPGSPDTRAAILLAARQAFATGGFDGATIRGVAAAAQVDPSLVHHYFGSKQDLFLAAVQLPVDPREILAPVVAAGPEGAGERLLTALLEVWDHPETGPSLVAAARTVVLGPGGDALVRDAFIPAIIAPILAQLVHERPEDRIPLVASQILGLVMSRYILAIEPLASLPAETVVARIAPSVQRFLTGDLP